MLEQNFQIEVEPFWPLRRLKGMLRERIEEEKLEEEGGKDGDSFKIRLVYRGHVLSDLDLQICDAGLTEDCVLHCMVSKMPKLSSRMPTATVLPHDELRGFSALSSAGYSDDEVEALRLTFFSHVVDFARNQPLNPREDPHDRWSRLEEEWMLGQARNPSSEFSLNASAYARQLRLSIPDHGAGGGGSGGDRATGLMPEGRMSAGFVSPRFAMATPQVPQTQQQVLESKITELRRTYSNAQIEQQLQQRVLAMRASMMTGNGDMPPGVVALSNNPNNDDRAELVGGSNAGTGQLEVQNSVSGTQTQQREGTWGQFCLGFILGFILGIIMVFWLFDRNMLPRRQRLGILLGMSLNLVLQFYGVDSGTDDTNKATGNLRVNLDIENQTALSLKDGVLPANQLIPLSALNHNDKRDGNLMQDKQELILGR